MTNLELLAEFSNVSVKLVDAHRSYQIKKSKNHDDGTDDKFMDELDQIVDKVNGLLVEMTDEEYEAISNDVFIEEDSHRALHDYVAKALDNHVTKNKLRGDYYLEEPEFISKEEYDEFKDEF